MIMKLSCISLFHPVSWVVLYSTLLDDLPLLKGIEHMTVPIV